MQNSVHRRRAFKRAACVANAGPALLSPALVLLPMHDGRARQQARLELLLQLPTNSVNRPTTKL
jgi:hypothetical protein